MRYQNLLYILTIPALLSFGHLPMPITIAQEQQAQPQKILLEEGTPVPLVFAQPLSSKYAVVGHTIELQLASDLKVGDAILARKGSRALGTIVQGKEKQNRRNAKFMEMRVDYLCVGEYHVKLGGEQTAKAKVSADTTVAATILFGLSGYLWSQERKQFVIPEGAPLLAFVIENIELPVIATQNKS